jgi:signal transduction histidine kinase
MSPRDRDLFALIVAAAAAVLGLGALGLQIDPGIRLRPDGSGLIVVESLGRFPSDRNYGGVHPGMVVTAVNDRELVRFPTWPTSDVAFDENGEPVATPVPTPTPEPQRPAVVALSDADVAAIVHDPVRTLAAVPAGDLARSYGPNDGPNGAGLSVSDLDYALQNSTEAWWIGLALLAGGGWWLVRGWAGSTLQALAVPVAVAIASPLVLLPAELTYSPPMIAAAMVLVALAMVPLAIGFYGQIDDPEARSIVRRLSIAAFVGAIVVGLGSVVTTAAPSILTSSHWALTGAIAFVPGFVAAKPIVPASVSGSPSTSRALVERNEILVVAVTVAIALLTFTTTGSSPFVLPLLLWLAIVLAAGRFTFRPLARLAARATMQRDLVVAAMEAERARIASDLHDDALQDVTLLIRRLEVAGDVDGADLARGVADRHRSISGDLRLPIRDDLGVGPALDWLVTRVERIAGGDIRLEVTDDRRPPADVELAVFRIAQEAIANAVKHGHPPIVVRYRSTPSGVSLSIDDAGPGIDPSASREAPESGHYGLLGMGQRAEAIGGILDVRRWPTGGTHVALEWRPR